MSLQLERYIGLAPAEERPIRISTNKSTIAQRPLGGGTSLLAKQTPAEIRQILAGWDARVVVYAAAERPQLQRSRT